MADQRTTAELLRAPTEGYAEAIGAWDRYKDLLRTCPHHGFTELHQLDTFYNALNPADHDSLNSVVGGNLLEKRTQDVFTIIKNKSKVRNSRNKLIVSQVKSSDANSSSSSEIAKLTHAVNQQTSAVTTAMTAILKQFQATPPPAFVKAVKEICVTCGGAHPYYQCLAADGNTFPEFQDNIQGYVSAFAVNYNQGHSGYRPLGMANQIQPLVVPLSELEKIKNMNEINMKAMQNQINNVKNELRKEMKTSIQALMSNQTNELKNMMASFFQMNTASTSGSRPLPSNIIANPKGELKAITTKSGIVLDGPSVPMPPPFINLEEDERVEETLTNPKLEVKDDIFDLEGDIILDSTKDLPPPHNINPLSGSTTSSSNHLLKEFTDELALITFLPRNDDLPFDIESDLREREYLLKHDSTMEMDSILKDLIDECNLDEPNDNLFDTIREMFTDEHALDYPSPPLYDEYDDDLFELDSDNKYVYDDPFNSKGEKIKESKLLIDELDLPRSSDFLSSLVYDSFLFEDFSEVDALSSTNNEDKVFNLGILIQENLSKDNVQATPDKNEKKLSISHSSLILEDFNPPLSDYELPFHKEVP
nr:hypothetical protein [Tanacetum cinerariifolium]